MRKDNYILIYRYFIITTGVIFLLGGMALFYLNAQIVTDENRFTNLPSRLYVGEAVENDTLSGGSLKGRILVGDFITEINGVRVKEITDFIDALNNIDSSSVINVKVFSFKRKGIYDVRIRSNELPENSLIVLQSGVFVLSTERDGASERAGILPGDIITKINGKTFENAYQADSLLKSFSYEKEYSYEILRNAKVFNVNLRLARFGVKIQYVGVFLAGALCLMLSIILMKKRGSLPGARLAATSLWAFGFVCVAGQISNLMTNPDAMKISLFTVNFFYHMSYAVAMIALFYLPAENVLITQRKSLRITVFGGVTLFFLLFTNLIFYASSSFRNQVIDFVLVSYWLFYITVFLYYLIRYRQGILRRSLRPRLLIAGVYMLHLTLVVTSQLSWLGDYIQKYWKALDYLNILAALAIPCAYFWIILRYRTFDLDLNLRRNTQYLLISNAIRAFFVIFFIYLLVVFSKIDLALPNVQFTGSSIEILDKRMNPQREKVYDSFLFFVFTLSAGYILKKSADIAIGALDRKYDRVRYDFKRALNEIVEIISKKISIKELAFEMSDKIAELFKIDKVAIFFFKDSRCIYEYFYSPADKAEAERTLLLNCDVLYERAKRRSGPVRAEYLEGDVRKAFEEAKFKFFVPIISKSDILAVLLLGSKLSETEYNSEDFEFLNSICSQAAIAIENSYLYEDLRSQERIKHELEIARKIQLASLPKQAPAVAGLDIAGGSYPAFEVGGDFFDIANFRNGLVSVIAGDVSGKGAFAALYMSKTQGILRTLQEYSESPRDLFIKTNKLLYCDIERNSFVTALAAYIDTSKNKMVVARAGHLPLYWYRAASRTIEIIKPAGIMLGACNSDTFNVNICETELHYENGDVFLFITDGILESRTPKGEEYGESRALNLLTQRSGESSAAIKAALLADVAEFSAPAEQFDDMTLVVVKTVSKNGL